MQHQMYLPAPDMPSGMRWTIPLCAPTYYELIPPQKRFGVPGKGFLETVMATAFFPSLFCFHSIPIRGNRVESGTRGRERASRKKSRTLLQTSTCMLFFIRSSLCQGHARVGYDGVWDPGALDCCILGSGTCHVDRVQCDYPCQNRCTNMRCLLRARGLTCASPIVRMNTCLLSIYFGNGMTSKARLCWNRYLMVWNSFLFFERIRLPDLDKKLSSNYFII